MPHEPWSDGLSFFRTLRPTLRSGPHRRRRVPVHSAPIRLPCFISGDRRLSSVRPATSAAVRQPPNLRMGRTVGSRDEPRGAAPDSDTGAAASIQRGHSVSGSSAEKGDQHADRDDDERPPDPPERHGQRHPAQRLGSPVPRRRAPRVPLGLRVLHRAEMISRPLSNTTG